MLLWFGWQCLSWSPGLRWVGGPGVVTQIPQNMDLKPANVAINILESTMNQITLPETNMVPENRPSQKENSIPTIHFQVLC